MPPGVTGSSGEGLEGCRIIVCMSYYLPISLAFLDQQLVNVPNVFLRENLMRLLQY